MLAELRREVGRLVVQTTAAVIGKVLTPDDQRRLAEETAQAPDERVGREDVTMQTTKQAQRDARQLFRLCLVDGSLDEARVRQVVQRVDRGGPARRARASCRGFSAWCGSTEPGTAPTWTSAAPLPADVRGRIEAALVAAATGRRSTTSFAENPALIGGVRVKVGSDVYDGSVRASLAALASRF